MSADAPPLDRTMPHSLDAERGVLGSLLLYPERADLIRGVVEADDFYAEPYGLIFQAILDMSDESQPIDTLTLGEELTRRGQFDLAGGTAGLASLSAAVPNSANLEYYAQIVCDKGKLRRLIKATTEILERSYEASEPADDLAGWAEHQVMTVSERGSQRDAASLKDSLKAAMAEIEALHGREDAGGITGLPTDFHEMDRMLGGLQRSEMIVVAGRPSMGKSTFVLNCMVRIGVEQNKTVALFSLEMSKENIARNMLCAYSGLNSQKVRTGRLSNEEWVQLGMSTGNLSEAPIFIDDTPAISLGELRGKCRRLKRSHNLSLVAIDYLQLMTGPQRGRDANRQQEISEISRGLKALARELEIPVIALSQLNRGVEGRTDHKPMLSDLRESGAIEQDADVVLLLHRPSYYNKDDMDNTAEVIIAKQRNGPTGTVELVFIGDKLRFENKSLHSDDEYAA